MNLGTHGMAVQGYIALHNGTYQNPELLMLAYRERSLLSISIPLHAILAFSLLPLYGSQYILKPFLEKTFVHTLRFLSGFVRMCCGYCSVDIGLLSRSFLSLSSAHPCVNIILSKVFLMVCCPRQKSSLFLFMIFSTKGTYRSSLVNFSLLD